MKSHTIILLAAFSQLIACTTYDHYAVNDHGYKMEKDHINKLGGTISARGSDGSSVVSDDQTSFRDFTTAATAVAGVVGNVRVTDSNNAVDHARIKANSTPHAPTIVPEGSTAIPPTFAPKQ